MVNVTFLSKKLQNYVIVTGTCGVVADIISGPEWKQSYFPRFESSQRPVNVNKALIINSS